MKLFYLLLAGTIFLAGCKKDLPEPPGMAWLEEPVKNSECTPVQSSDGIINVVRFAWKPADHTEIYELRVTDLTTNTVRTISTTKTTETLPLPIGTAFSWTVISKNSQTTLNVPSATWLFFNPGSQTQHAPFPAEILSPKMGSTVFKDIDNEIELQWSGADIDNDIEGYKIYFETETPPKVLIASPGTNETSRKVSVVSGTVYYWKVITTDSEGNLSDTGVLDFRVY